MPFDPKKLDAALRRLEFDPAKLDARMTPPPRPARDTILDYYDQLDSGPTPGARLLGQVGSGANRGIQGVSGMMLGAPVDAVNALGSMAGLPTSPEPVMGSKWISEKMRGVMPDPQVPETTAERFADRIGEEVGASVPAAVGGLAVRGATLAGRVAGPSLRTLGESLLKLSPEKLVATEAALASSAGTGGAIGREMFPDSVSAEIVGQLVGGVGLPVTYSLVRDMARRARSRIGLMTDGEIKTAAGELLDRHVPPEQFGFDEGFAERAALREDIPGFSPTTAQMSYSPGLASAERSRLAGDKNFAWRYENMQSSNQEAFKDFFARIHGVPRDGATIADTQDALRVILDERIAQSTRAATQKVRAGVGMTSDEAGKVLRAQLNDAEADFRLAADGLFAKVDPGNAIEMPLGDIADVVRRQVQDRPVLDAAEDLPSAAVELHRFIDSKVRDSVGERAAQMGFAGDDEVVTMLTRDSLASSTIPFNDLRSIRSRIVGDLRAAKRAVGDTRRDVKIRRLSELLGAVESTLDTLGTRADAPDIAEAYRTANRFYRDGVQRFRAGAAAAIRANNGSGRMNIPDNMVGREFFGQGPGGLQKGEDFKAAIVRLNETPEGARWLASPQGQQALRDDVIYRLAETGDTEGRLSLREIQAWRGKHRDALRMFPDIDRETASLEKAQSLLERNAAVLKRSAEEVERSAIGRVMNADPDRAVRALLSGPSPAKNVKRLMGLIGDNPEATNGLRRSVIDYIESRSELGKRTLSEVPFMSPFKLRQIRKELKGVLPQIYDREHLRKLTVAERVAEVVARSERSRVTGSDTFEKMSAGTPGISAVQLLEAMPGVGWKGRLVARATTGAWKRFRGGINNSMVERLFQDALIDPEAADILYWHVRGAKPETTIRRLNLHLANRVPAAAMTLDEAIPDPADASEGATPTPRPTRESYRFTAQAPPPPPPKLPKPPKPVDVSKDLQRGIITPGDAAELARMGAR